MELVTVKVNGKDCRALKLLTLYLDPETHEVILESPSEANRMSLPELREVAHHLQSWIYDIALVILRATGRDVKKEEAVIKV